MPGRPGRVRRQVCHPRLHKGGDRVHPGLRGVHVVSFRGLSAACRGADAAPPTNSTRYLVGSEGAGGATLAQVRGFPGYVRGRCNKEYGKTTCIGRWTAVGEDPAVQQCPPDKIDASKLCDEKYVCTPFINKVNKIVDDCKNDEYLKNDPAFQELPAQLAPVNKAKPQCKKDSAAPAQGIVGAAAGLLSFAALMLF